MQKNPVTIKSFPNGFEVILDDKLPFDELLGEVAAKFGENARFFGSAKKAISFEGRALSPREEDDLIYAIMDSCDVQVSCVIEKDNERNDVYFRAMEQFTKASDGAGSQVYVGTVKSGQTLEARRGITIIGDVNPGATVVSGGSVVVLGTLYGSAEAGVIWEDEDVGLVEVEDDPSAGSLLNGGCFVAALEMKPTEIIVNGVIAQLKKDALKVPLLSKNSAKIAYEKGGDIIIESITKEFTSRL